jgi:hypothetical protein
MTLQKKGVCYCCKKPADVNVSLVDQDGRIYIPNQKVRKYGHPCLMDIWFCRHCMRVLEDTLRATIAYWINENKEAGT